MIFLRFFSLFFLIEFYQRPAQTVTHEKRGTWAVPCLVSSSERKAYYINNERFFSALSVRYAGFRGRSGGALCFFMFGAANERASSPAGQLQNEAFLLVSGQSEDGEGDQVDHEDHDNLDDQQSPSRCRKGTQGEITDQP